MSVIGVSILNYQAADLTVSCLLHLERARAALQGGHTVRVWLLDNGSGSADRDVLQAAMVDKEWVSVTFNERNSGFAAGHNQNLRRMFDQETPDYVWLLNNDCLVDEGCIVALLACSSSDPAVAIWGATLLEPDRVTLQCAGGCYYSDWLTSYRQFGSGRELAELAGIRPRPFDYIAGASMWIPERTLREELGPAPSHPADPPGAERQWLNETYFLYFEELDLARRLRFGRRLGWCRDAVIVHGVRLRDGDRRRRWVAEYHSDLSALKFTWLHQPRKLWFALPARFLLKTARHVALMRWYLVPCMSRAYLEFYRWRVRRGAAPRTT